MRIPDRQKQRREYLRKKAGAVIGGTGGGLLFVWLALTTCVFGILTLVMFLAHGFEAETLYWPLIIKLLVGTMISGCLATASLWYMTKQSEAAKRLPYVPPVILDTLPADEVLVRGSQEPVQQQSTVLLRAADENADTPVGELLRASTAHPNQ